MDPEVLNSTKKISMHNRLVLYSVWTVSRLKVSCETATDLTWKATISLILLRHTLNLLGAYQIKIMSNSCATLSTSRKKLSNSRKH